MDCSFIRFAIQRDLRIAPVILEAAKRVKERLPDATVMVPLSGPFSIASNLVGFDTLLMATMVDPDATREALLHLAENEFAGR